jgi:hypothetical protein
MNIYLIDCTCNATETGLQRRHYKLVVTVSLGEQRGEGVRICSRALWDADTDTHASHLFLNVRVKGYYIIIHLIFKMIHYPSLAYFPYYYLTSFLPFYTFTNHSDTVEGSKLSSQSSEYMSSKRGDRSL